MTRQIGRIWACQAQRLAFAWLSAAMLATPLVAQLPPSPAAPVTSTTDWQKWKDNCASVTQQFGANSLIACASSTFTSRPFHFLAQSVVPGSGVGGGGRYSRDFNHDNWQNQLQLSGVMTIRQFWYTEAKFTAQRPSFFRNTQEGFGVELYARNRQMPTLPFYGLGPNTNVNNSVRFSERDTRAGVTVSNPFTDWLAVSGTFESLWPSIGGVHDAAVPSIEQVYDEATAPGLATQPNFLHYEIQARPHKLFADRFLVDYRFRYGFFQDTGSGHYSFRRFTADFQHSFFPERINGHRRTDSVLSARFRISASDASAGNAVPFYLQETIGGSDIDNQTTLRAFRDYRFRGPDSFLVQAEYDRRIIGPLGILAFYDAGKVTLNKSDLNFNDLHQGFGGGLSFFLGGRLVFRAYVGLGGGEGAHPYFGIANFL